jgi:hypothetical protein
VGPAYQKTRRPVSGPNRPGWQPTRLPENLLEDSPNDLVHHDLKTRRTRQDLGVLHDQSRSTGYGKMCNVDLGLLVVTDQESGNRPHPLANIRRTRRPLVTYAIPKQSTPITGRRSYSPEARTSINSPCSLCFAYSCATFEFLALDSSPPNN